MNPKRRIPVTRRIDATVAGALLRLGFSGKRGILSCPLAKDAVGSIGLNKATEHYRGAAAVNPVVGVWYAAIERRLESLTQRSWQRSPTVSTPIGYIMPARRYREWEFFADEPMEPIAADLAKAVEHYALPWMRAHTTLEAIGAYIPTGNSHYKEYRLPVVLAMLGREAEAFAVIQQNLEKHCQQDIPYARDYRAFVETFRARLPLTP